MPAKTQTGTENTPKVEVHQRNFPVNVFYQTIYNCIRADIRLSFSHHESMATFGCFRSQISELINIKNTTFVEAQPNIVFAQYNRYLRKRFFNIFNFQTRGCQQQKTSNRYIKHNYGIRPPEELFCKYFVKLSILVSVYMSLYRLLIMSQ